MLFLVAIQLIQAYYFENHPLAIIIVNCKADHFLEHVVVLNSKE